MGDPWLVFRSLLTVGMISLGAPAWADAPAARSERAAAKTSKPAQDAKALAARIDALIAACWAEKSIKPSNAAGDAEFGRRVYLDLIGRIPRYRELSDFLDDQSPDKRFHLVERLLETGLYARHFTTVWKALLVPPSNNQQLAFLGQGMDPWLQNRFRQNMGFDQLVRELITAPINGLNPRGGIVRQGFNPNEPQPTAFFQASEYRAENLAAATSRLFLGVKLECAQCHNHPFARWSRSQFWEFAAFFSGIEPVDSNNIFQPKPDNPQKRELKIPGTEQTVTASFLEGPAPQWKENVNTRTILADWLTARDNPFFARAIANRMWAHFFGIGLIDPVDEPGDDNPPSHPDLLNELATQLAAHDFDLKFLIRGIVASQAYQLSSEATHPSQDDLRSLGRMPIKGLTGEQLFDSLTVATGYRDRTPVNGRQFNPLGNNPPRAEFLNRFSGNDKRTEYHTSILQALALMNGNFVSELTSADLEKSEALAAVTDSPFLDHAQQIETLYMMTLSRKPRPAERDRLVKYVVGGGVSGDAKKALADVFWALLNSSEFILNH